MRPRPQSGLLFLALAALAAVTPLQGQSVGLLRGEIVDAETGTPVAARLYIQSETGDWFHAESANSDGNAVPYSKIRGNGSVEVHTSLGAHAFKVELPPGRYTLTAEKGKEYLPLTEEVEVRAGSAGTEPVTLPLTRWIDMAARNWYSGETHVHRAMEELPTLLLAEDLNVAFPLTAWVTDSRAAPSTGSKNPDRVPPARLVEVDETHVIWPVNTEYEIFTVDGERHVLGAVFVLNHKEPLSLAAPPVKPIAKEAARQGGILELDKHNWPWSMMIVPVMKVGLFELTNNHIWRTRFQFKNWYSEYTGDYMGIEKVDGGFTERGWIDFGFKTYYALLNCGFKMQPTAGTASGVHPVPLGFGRVYVKINDGFSYEKWLQGLLEGRSFATTGPMLEVETARRGNRVRVSGAFDSVNKAGPIEIIKNGVVIDTVDARERSRRGGGYRAQFSRSYRIEESAWFAVRGFEDRSDGRPRFAHTAPVHFEIEGKPLQPRPEEVAYLIKRVEDELQRHQGVLSEAALAEYREAAAFYRDLLPDE